MKRRSKLISCFLAMFLIFQVILPVNSSGKVFADSQVGDSVSETQNGDQSLSEKPEVSVPDDDFVGEVKPGDNPQEEVKSDEEVNPQEEVKPEEDPEKQNVDMEDDSLVKSDEEISGENESSNAVEEEEKPGVLDGGIYDAPITNWTFRGVEDLNGDGIVSEKDLALASTKYNSKRGQATYDDSMDFNNDGIIDVYDLVLVSSKIGTKGKIVIDPGHGGSDPGAIGPTGLKEKDVVLNVGLKVRDLLQDYGYTVIMTRTTDVDVSLQKRCDIANNSEADFFVSIHNNSFSNPSANGTETYSFFPNDLGGQLAKSIQSKLLSALGRTNRGHKTADFYVLRNTNMPAALAELAFISNPTEEALLRTDDFQTKAARAIVEGIIGF